MDSIKLYFLTFFVFFLVDIVWLGVLSKNIYSKYLGHLMAQNVNWVAAIIPGFPERLTIKKLKITIKH